MSEIAEVDRLRTIAVLNQKGGVGKTTTTVNTAAALAAQGLKVVVIDLDPQAHLTIHLGVEPQTIQTGAYDVLTQSAQFEPSLMMTRPNLWLLGANINLVGAETELVSVVGREIILREAMLACQSQFDYCLIDCAPSLGLLSLNALAASQEVLIPLQPHFLALQGFGKLLQTVDLVNKRINPNLKVSGVLLCMFDTRASLPNEVRADIDRFLTNARGSASAWAEAQILPTFIRRNIKLAEAPSYGQTILEYDPTCNGAADYRNVARFFMGLAPQTEDDLDTELEGEAQPEVTVTPEREEEASHDPAVASDAAPVDELVAVPEPQSQQPSDAEPIGSADSPSENGGVFDAAARESYADPASASDPAPADEQVIVPESQAQGPHDAELIHPAETAPQNEEGLEAAPHESCGDPASATGAEFEDEPAPASEERSPEVHQGPEGSDQAQRATESAPTPESGTWSLHHTPELRPGPGAAARQEVAASQTDAERSDQPSDAAASADEQGAAPVPPQQDAPRHPRIRIREFHWPAPPLRSYPIPPARSSEPSQETGVDGKDQPQAPERPDDQQHVGF